LAAEHGESLEFAAEAVDLRQVLSTVKLVISNAGHGLTLQCLLAGKPLLLLPTHWEQSLVAGMAVKIGAAIAVLPNEQHPKFHRRIDDLLQNTAYRDAAEGFAKCHQDSSRDIALEKAVHTCEARAARQDSQTKLTVVG
jgi:UDP:flavonoid glycosyltransferase YjiC (YdhE family)